MAREHIVICAEGHLFRVPLPGGSVGDVGRAGCPVCHRVLPARIVDPRMLSQEALAEAWQHRGLPR